MAPKGRETAKKLRDVGARPRLNQVPATLLWPFFGAVIHHAGSNSFRMALGVAEGEGFAAGSGSFRMGLGVVEGEGFAPRTALFL